MRRSLRLWWVSWLLVPALILGMSPSRVLAGQSVGDEAQATEQVPEADEAVVDSSLYAADAGEDSLQEETIQPIGEDEEQAEALAADVEVPQEPTEAVEDSTDEGLDAENEILVAQSAESGSAASEQLINVDEYVPEFTLDTNESKRLTFRLTQGSVVNIMIDWFQSSGSSALFDVALTNQSGVKVLTCNATRQNADKIDSVIKSGTHSLGMIYLKAGTYYLDITSHAPSLVIGILKVSTLTTSESHAYDLEPNDSLATASSLAIGKDVSGILYDARQHGATTLTGEDYYRFGISEIGNVTVDLFLAQTSSLSIEVIDAAGVSKGTLSQSAGNLKGSGGFYSGKLTLKGCEPGTYYLHVRGSFPNSSATTLAERLFFYESMEYDFRVLYESTAVHGPQEEPITLPLGKQQDVRVRLDEGQSQCFSFTTTKDDAVSLDISWIDEMLSTNAAAVTLAREDGSDAMTWRLGRTNADAVNKQDKEYSHVFSPILLKKGSWRLSVTSSVDGLVIKSAGVTDLGLMAAASSAAGSINSLEHETNDTRAKANVVSLGSTMLAGFYDPRFHNAAGKELVDWYKLQIDSRDYYRVSYGMPQGAMRLEVYAEGQSEPLRTGQVDAGSTTSGWYKGSADLGWLDAGTYYIKVAHTFDATILLTASCKNTALYFIRPTSGSPTTATGYALLRADGTLWKCSSDGTPTSSAWSLYADPETMTTLYVEATATAVPLDVQYRYGTSGASTASRSLQSLVYRLGTVVFLPDKDGSSRVERIEESTFSASPVSKIENLDKTKVAEIGEYAFKGCQNLSELTLPPTLGTIGDYAFQDCQSLSTLTLRSGRFPEIGSMTFDGTPLNTSESAHVYFTKRMEWSGGLGEVGASWQNLSAQKSFVSDSPIDVSEAEVSGLVDTYYYDATPKTQDLTLTVDGRSLVEGVDYSISYEDNVYVGTAKVVLTGMGNFGGSHALTYSILRRTSLARAEVAGVVDKIYEEGGVTQEPVVTVGDKVLMEGRDYSLSYLNNTKAGTATVIISGINAYVGSTSRRFQIQLLDISKATITGLKATYKKTGKPIKPKVTVSVDDRTLEEGVDYTVTYNANVNPGTATVIVKGKAGCTGTVKKSFKIYQTATIPKKRQIFGWKKNRGPSAATVGRGLTKLSSKGAEGYIKFKAPKTATYTFTFSDFRREKSSWGYLDLYGNLYLQDGLGRHLTATTQGGKTDAFRVASKGYAETSGGMLQRSLASRYVKTRIKKGATVYFYIWTTADYFSCNVNIS